MTHPAPTPAPADSAPTRSTAFLSSVVGILGLGLVLLLGIALTSPAPASGAAPERLSGAALAGLVPDAPAPGRAWIQGIVTDRAGKPQDNVLVQAFEMGEYDAPVASWVTYASPLGGRQHGFYRLYVRGGASGYYEIRYSSLPGSADPFRTTMYDGVVHARNGRIEQLDTVELQRVRRGVSTTRAKVARAGSGKAASQSAKARPVLKVSVTCPDVDPLTGTVVVAVGSRKITTKLTEAASGTVSVKLPRLKPGRHRVTVSYGGAEGVGPSQDKVTVKVKPSRRR